MVSHFGNAWHLGIFDTIKIFIIDMNMDWELLVATLNFWYPAINTKIFPLDPMGPTILDVTIILNTSLTGLPVDFILSTRKYNLDLRVIFDEKA